MDGWMDGWVVGCMDEAWKEREIDLTNDEHILQESCAFHSHDLIYSSQQCYEVGIMVILN